MIKTSLAAAALAMATLGAATTPASAATSITVQIGPPPAPYYEAVPTPRRGQVWLPGHWEWRGNHHAWVAGQFVRARPGYQYVQPTYVRQGNRWDYRAGYWAHENRAHDNRGGRGDRDHDGIANRYDRDRDNDGVPNRYDRHPDNRNRS